MLIACPLHGIGSAAGRPSLAAPSQVDKMAASMAAGAQEQKQEAKARNQARFAPSGGTVRRSSRSTAEATKARLKQAAAEASGKAPRSWDHYH